MNENEKDDLYEHMMAELFAMRNRIAIGNGGAPRSGDATFIDDPEFEEEWIKACHTQVVVSKHLMMQTEEERYKDVFDMIMRARPR
jgi:hypothetical protein